MQGGQTVLLWRAGGWPARAPTDSWATPRACGSEQAAWGAVSGLGAFFLYRSFACGWKGHFQALLDAGKKRKRLMFCIAKYLYGPDVSWRPPCPTGAMSNQL